MDSGEWETITEDIDRHRQVIERAEHCTDAAPIRQGANEKKWDVEEEL